MCVKTSDTNTYLGVKRCRERRQPIRQSPQQVSADGGIVGGRQRHGAEARAQRGGEAVQVVRVLTLLKTRERVSEAADKLGKIFPGKWMNLSNYCVCK